MWSYEYAGRPSALASTQRVLFPVLEHTDAIKRALAPALQTGMCTGLFLTDIDDSATLFNTHATLQSVLKKNTLLSPAHFCFVAETGPDWTLESFDDRLHNTLAHLQTAALDLLLLSVTSLPPTTTLHDQKRVVQQYWQKMAAIQQRGLAKKIRVSQFCLSRIEFVFNGFPENPPQAFVAVLSLPQRTVQNSRAVTSSTSIVPLEQLLSFAFGRGMDVLVKFPIRLDGLPRELQTKWRQLAQQIADAQHMKEFEVGVTVESDTKSLFEVQKRSLRGSEVLKSPLLVIGRYLLQKGLVVIPVAGEDDAECGENGQALDNDEYYELFHALLHPLTTVGPAYSANAAYTSVLSREEMERIDHLLAFQAVLQ